jgi:hypothetical protein
MIYIINRASDFRNKRPCEEAVLRPFENWQERCCTEEYFDEHYSQRLGLWRSKGINHTTTLDGNIIRQIEDKLLYIIDINTLEDLHKLIDKYGTLIIDNGDSINKTPTITIYDDYME